MNDIVEEIHHRFVDLLYLLMMITFVLLIEDDFILSEVMIEVLINS